MRRTAPRTARFIALLTGVLIAATGLLATFENAAGSPASDTAGFSATSSGGCQAKCPHCWPLTVRCIWSEGHLGVHCCKRKHHLY